MTYHDGDSVVIRDGSSKDGRAGVVAIAEDQDGDIMVDVGEKVWWPVKSTELEPVKGKQVGE